MVIYSLQCVAYSMGNYDKGAKSPTGVFKIFFYKIGYTTENYEMHVHGQHGCNMCWVACRTRTSCAKHVRFYSSFKAVSTVVLLKFGLFCLIWVREKVESLKERVYG